MADSTYDRHPEALERLQAVLLEVLVAIDELCRKNDITYFIDGGTTLGAVRHGGFIPWDDDIDVAMPAEDYLRFIEIAPRELPAGFSLSTTTQTPGQSALWAKVTKDGTRMIDRDAQMAGCAQGIFADIFPYIRLDADSAKAQRQYRKAIFWQRMSYLHHIARPYRVVTGPHGAIKGLACTLAHHTIARAYTPKAMLGMYQSTFFCENPGPIWTNPSGVKLYEHADETLFPVQEIGFAGKSFFAPRDLDTYLHTIYGDYMQVPPPEQRRTHTPLILDFGDGVNAVAQ